MSLLKSLTTDSNIQGEKDQIGTLVPDSGLYNCKVTLAYLSKVPSGATGLFLTLMTDKGDEMKHSLYITSGTEKGCKNTYQNSKGETQYLPGFLQANSLCVLAVGKPIDQMDTEEKVLSLYNFESRTDVPTKKEVLVDLLGKDIIIGLIKVKADKSVKNDQGKYIPTGETRFESEIDKFFHAESRMTTSEIASNAEKAVFIDTWNTKWTGKEKDKSTKGAVGSVGTFGVPKPANNTTPPVVSLFGTN